MKLPLPVVRTFLRLLVRPLYGPPVPVRVQRRVGDALGRLQLQPKGVVATDVVLAGRGARRYTPPGATAGLAVLWVHGGAFITGSYRTHGSFAAHLAVAVGAPVYLLDYRLAPEHQHPAGLDDVVAALALVPEARVVLGGDSAGGCLALLATACDTRPLAGLALVSPLVDLTLASGRAWQGDDVLIRTAWGEQGVTAMFGASRPAPPTSVGVPVVVHVAETERLRPEGEALAKALGAELVVVPDGWHDIHLQAGALTVAHTAVVQLGRSIRAMLSAQDAGHEQQQQRQADGQG